MTESKLNSLMSFQPNQGVDHPTTRRLIEDHLTWLIEHPDTTETPVTPHQLHVYEFDWIGLLAHLNVTQNNYWAVIRMNGGMSYTDVPQDITSLLVPSNSAVTRLVELQFSGKKTA